MSVQKYTARMSQGGRRRRKLTSPSRAGTGAAKATEEAARRKEVAKASIFVVGSRYEKHVGD
jgi:hypothetical protein